MKSWNHGRTATIVAFAAWLSACATTPPTELLDARSAYVSSSRGLAARLTPADIEEGKALLDRANLEFDRHGDTSTCRDLAYMAQRKLDLADVKARTERDRRAIEEAVKAGVVMHAAPVKSGQAALVP